MYVMDSYNTTYRDWIAYSEDLLNWHIKRISPMLGGESCIAITDYTDKANDGIILLYAGGLMGQSDHLDHLKWDYSTTNVSTRVK